MFGALKPIAHLDPFPLTILFLRWGHSAVIIRDHVKQLFDLMIVHATGLSGSKTLCPSDINYNPFLESIIPGRRRA
jgi:hypothetical protein